MVVLNSAIIHQALTLLPAGLCEFSNGIGYGWTAPTVKRFQESRGEFFLTTNECSWIASLPNFFRAIGTVIVFFTIDVIGRKKLYYILAVFYLISWSLILSSHSVPIIYLARSIFGLMAGISDATSPIYLTENSSPKLRGGFGSLSISFYYMAVLVAYSSCTYLSYNTVALVNVIIQCVVLLSALLLKETPQFLIMKERCNEAQKVFFWLQASKSNETKLQFENMIKYAKKENNEELSFWQVLSNKANYKSVVIVSTIGVLFMFAGSGAVSSFVTTEFSQSSSTISPESLTILYGVVQLTSIWTSSCFIDRFNRRTILMGGFFASGITHFVTAFLYYWQDNVSKIPYFEWLVFSTITLYATIGATTLYPVFFVTQGELFSQKIKAFGSCLAVTTNSLAGFATTFVFLQITGTYGIYFNFLFFSIMSVLATAYVYIYLPEARGKSLVDIQKKLEK